MRKLKFRVWNNKTNDWVEGHGRNDNPSLDGVNLFGETILLGAFMDGVSLEDLNDCVAVEYTGLDDGGGKQIFEGDILSVEGHQNVKVFFEKGAFWTTPLEKDMDFNFPLFGLFTLLDGKCRVIGNIFENPDLIK